MRVRLWGPHLPADSLVVGLLAPLQGRLHGGLPGGVPALLPPLPGQPREEAGGAAGGGRGRGAGVAVARALRPAPCTAVAPVLHFTAGSACRVAVFCPSGSDAGSDAPAPHASQHLDPAYYLQQAHRVAGGSRERSLAGTMMPAPPAGAYPFVSPDRPDSEAPHFVAEVFFMTQVGGLPVWACMCICVLVWRTGQPAHGPC